MNSASPVKLAYEEHGSGFPMIFIHGYPLNRSTWKPLVPFMQKSVRMILVDLRGLGESPVVEGVYSMSAMAEDIHALMDRLGIAKACLVGHSMGGYVSMAFARAYPERLAGLGLVATHAKADSPEVRQTRIKQADEVLQNGVTVVSETMPLRLSTLPKIQALMRDVILSADRRAVYGCLRGMAVREEALTWLPDVHVPCVVIAGINDAIVPLEAAKQMAAALPQGRLLELPGTGHMPMMEKPQAVAQALNQLLDIIIN
jgi:3-oxoadipate enol-lactonase